MNVYEIHKIDELIKDNPYVGRGLVVGNSEDGKKVCAYFIMGRSANSRNRVFEIKDGEVFTKPFDESKVEDPSLIIYAALRKYENNLIVTNGDQTDTIYEGYESGKSFFTSLESRTFEPDAPNFTPRISASLHLNDGSYELSILKSIDEEGSACVRQCFVYPPKKGLGHFIHTYVTDGNPIPSFTGEPERVLIPKDINEFTDTLWNSLNEDNKISLYVRYTNNDGTYEERLVNKNI